MLSPRIKVHENRIVTYPDCSTIDEAARILRENWRPYHHAHFIVDLDNVSDVTYLWSKGADPAEIAAGYYAFDGKRYYVERGNYWIFVKTGSDYHDRNTIAAITSTGRIVDASSRHSKLVASAILADPVARQMEWGRITGKCARCGRHLEDPVSRAIGMGPICREKA